MLNKGEEIVYYLILVDVLFTSNWEYGFLKIMDINFVWKQKKIWR